jgi:hypothetical protein
MTTDRPTPPGVPDDWDRLEPTTDHAPEGGPVVTPDAPGAPPLVALVAAAWGDLVTLLAVCAAALLAVVAFGYGTGLDALPWAAGVAVAWWTVAASALLAVRRGTPGMLLAGVAFADRVAGRQLAATVATALLLAVTAGLPSLAGRRHSLLGLAAGTPPSVIREGWKDDA